jgi:hypothetical protein
MNFVFQKACYVEKTGIFASEFMQIILILQNSSFLKFSTKCPTSRQWRRKRRRPLLTLHRLRTARTARLYRSHRRKASWPTGVSLSPRSGGIAGSAFAHSFAVQTSHLFFSGLYLMALFCIYFGARRSVRFVRDSILEHKPIENSITSKEARMFPFTASGVLFGLYLFFKYGERFGVNSVCLFLVIFLESGKANSL